MDQLIVDDLRLISRWAISCNSRAKSVPTYPVVENSLNNRSVVSFLNCCCLNPGGRLATFGAFYQRIGMAAWVEAAKVCALVVSSGMVKRERIWNSIQRKPSPHTIISKPLISCASFRALSSSVAM